MSKPTPLSEISQKTEKRRSEKKSEDSENKTERATEYFRKMFAAHDTMEIIKEKVDKLYSSAEYISPLFDGTSKSNSNSKRAFEAAIEKIEDLKDDYRKLFDERAAFDLFVCRLSKKEIDVLSLRCEKNMSWKQVSSELKISDTTAKEIYNDVVGKACNTFDF